MKAIEEQVFLCSISQCLPDEERSTLTSKFLSDTERKKLLLITDEKKRDEYLQSHAFVNWKLSQKLEVSPSSISFYTNRFGKPFILEEINKRQLFFNLSHTGGLIGFNY
jgi:phosphopantetheinyl transferase